MKVTNELNLPQAFVNAVSRKRHNATGCFSATTLNKGAKEIVLTDRHYDELTVDASDNVWAVFGTAVHCLLENQTDNNFHEEHIELPVSNSTVTGTIDSYDLEHATIYDWKTASTWKVIYQDFADWYQQGMTYAWLLTKTGLEVRRCKFVALLKDHSKTKARQDCTYPQSPVFVYEFEVTPEELQQTEQRIYDKVREIEAAYELADDDITPCTDAERWADGEKWAVMKNGRKSAVKLFDTRAEAEAMAGENGNSYYVEHRPAVSKKCLEYCSCCDFCSFYHEITKGE